ncbi:uncharacterized protein N7459_008987 [Penicillium hispanicum]|uniref:uncharacterized protein n=1 Tax=Penicillium hispanicum TaxID=1080232 RepID=UPI002541EA87|nr:uncharacterized protein N7459_008987 [Penicillium hispanicum]KAJ5569557.1 hypothetical protein N7459_008987 [Penicillium hispanicum]
MCVIRPADIRSMWDDKNSVVSQATFNQLFVEDFLGPVGHLTTAYNTLRFLQAAGNEATCGALGDFQVFAAQLAAGSNLKKTMNREALITAIAQRLVPKSVTEGLTADITVYLYTFQVSTAYQQKTWKAAMEQQAPALTAEVRIGFRGLWDNQPQGQVGQISLRNGIPYECLGVSAIPCYAFSEGTSNYEASAFKTVKYEEKMDRDTLYQWGSGYTNNRRQLEFSAPVASRCQLVLWSRGGALLDFMNDNAESTFLTLTSAGAVLCYFPEMRGKAANNDFATQKILAPLVGILQDLDRQRSPSAEPITIYQSKLWYTLPAGGKTSPSTQSCLAFIHAQFQSAVRAKITVTANSNFDIQESSVQLRWFQKHINSNFKLGWMAVYQEPTTDNTTPGVVIMEMDGPQDVISKDLIAFQFSG